MDFIIYSEHKDLTEGMFGQCLIWLLEILNILQDQKYIQENSKIHFNVNSLPYDNLIPS